MRFSASAQSTSVAVPSATACARRPISSAQASSAPASADSSKLRSRSLASAARSSSGKARASLLSFSALIPKSLTRSEYGADDPGADAAIPSRKWAQVRDLPDRALAQKTKTPTVVGVFCGGAGNRTRVREASSQLSFTCVVGLPNRRGPANSVVEPSSRFSRPRRPEHRRDPALVMTPFRYQNYLSVGRLHCSLGSESDCIVVCNWYGPILERVGCLHTQTNLRSPRRNRSPPKGCGSGQHSDRGPPVKAYSLAQR